MLTVDLFLNAIKGQANSMNLILFTTILSYLLYKLKRRRTGAAFAIAAFSFFILFSTHYLPGYLVSRMESQYPPFDAGQFSIRHDRVYIHVLGGGYTLDERLPASSQLSGAGLGRLSEAIRIYHLLDSSVLVVSGNVASGNESLASVARKAAVSLGIEKNRIEMLDQPSTTLGEARAFANRFGSASAVIVVTDAVHMPRAIKFFKDQGLNPYPAPANYYIKHDDNPFALRWVPSAENFLLMDRVMREFFGEVKGWVVRGR